MTVTEQQRRKKYVPSLANLQAVCAANYVSLQRLLPEVDEQNMAYCFAAGSNLSYSIVIQQCEPYTTTVEMRQNSSGLPDYLQPVMQIRLYHDANLAEVLGFQHMSRFRPSYQYPNQLMHQKNEKELVNHFLAEWLGFCLRNASSSTVSP
ncbi:DUF1249 domain-containing protein [Lacimicrobium alkaliphilum]|uniref:Phosphohydrolase n=1 Tax=Lacimicrobium alkaliphilum TaxID=1526571 RepID=A0ABQ1QX92_9ALTE|nr:DUF1249 domain-containing protein [Lacimicrobium alkaliphilum]GGD48387.1 phosphohydrolase [Lacimicrobium alkaliphilum]